VKPLIMTFSVTYLPVTYRHKKRLNRVFCAFIDLVFLTILFICS